jgi:hypothetical protein
VILIVIAVFLTIAFWAIIALALARTAQRADSELEQQLLRSTAGEERAAHAGYARLAAAHLTIACEPSMTVSSSSTSVGTHWFPVSSFTSRLPRVRFSTSGNTPRP